VSFCFGLSALEHFAELPNFFAELGDFVFDSLMLLSRTAIVLEFHREWGNRAPVLVGPALRAAPVLAVTGLAILTTALLPAELAKLILPLVLAGPHVAVETAQRRRHCHLLVVPLNRKLHLLARLLIFNRAD